jgi:hypothetical protein
LTIKSAISDIRHWASDIAKNYCCVERVHTVVKNTNLCEDRVKNHGKGSEKCGNDTGENPPNRGAGYVTLSQLAERKGRTLADFLAATTVMEFPPTWRVFLDEDFETAQPQIEGAATMELMV